MFPRPAFLPARCWWRPLWLSFPTPLVSVLLCFARLRTWRSGRLAPRERRREAALGHHGASRIGLCVAMGIAAEWEANQQTQVLPVEMINLLLGYNRRDEIPTHRGPLSIRALAERLMKARSVDFKHHVTERPLHVRSLLYYVLEAVLDADDSPVLAAPLPVLESAIPRRPPIADPGAPIRVMVVNGGSRAPAAPRRPSLALPLRSIAPPRSPSFTVLPPSTRPPAPAVPFGRPSRSGAPIRSAPPLC